MTEPIYTAISFAPVQGFIEKSRKLRDLFGASLILSYLSQKLIEDLHKIPSVTVISPALPNVMKGMPNRILVKAEQEINRDCVRQSLLKHWKNLLTVCREWVEEKIDGLDYEWSQSQKDENQRKGEWERCGEHTWEVFWGYGNDPHIAMEDLETRKLKRDWTAINWVGESSSLSGTDAIAWPQLGKQRNPSEGLSPNEKEALIDFYLRLSDALEADSPDDEEPQGKFLRSNERLSIPELVKRLVTRYEDIGKKLGKDFRIDSFSEMVRLPEPGQSGHWTGWFMGDGDKVGDHLKGLKTDDELRAFSQAMREWGRAFKDQFPEELGRVVYAGGDDFMGVIYSRKPDNPIPVSRALDWLNGLNAEWKTHKQPINLSLGFVWAGHSVPQRDVLQHCREAEKRSKSLGRDRVTIRVVFNSGQYVQWTCPWDYLDILTKYRDRNHRDKPNSSEEQNWNHLYTDWETLKARHAIQLNPKLYEDQDQSANQPSKEVAIALFNLYFQDEGIRFENEKLWVELAGDNTDLAIMTWINDLVQVGWQLCRNSAP